MSLLNIQYKIIKTFPSEGQFVVRYLTDILTPEVLASMIDPITNEILVCRTDVIITLPVPVPSDVIIQAIIKANCPRAWMETEELRILSLTTPNASIEARAAAITDLDSSLGSVSFTPVVISAEQQKVIDTTKVDTDASRIISEVVKGFSLEYQEAEAQAQAYKAAAYSGTVPPFVANWVTTNTKGLTTAKQAADDILDQAAVWEAAAMLIRTTRLSTKKAIFEDIPNALAPWNSFVTTIRASLGLAPISPQ